MNLNMEKTKSILAKKSLSQQPTYRNKTKGRAKSAYTSTSKKPLTYFKTQVELKEK